MSKTSTTVKDRYNKKAYDDIRLRVKTGEKEIIKNFAESKGKSVNAYITDLIKADMEKGEG